MEDRIAVSTPTMPPDAIKALMMLHADMIQWTGQPFVDIRLP